MPVSGKRGRRGRWSECPVSAQGEGGEVSVRKARKERGGGCTLRTVRTATDCYTTAAFVTYPIMVKLQVATPI